MFLIIYFLLFNLLFQRFSIPPSIYVTARYQILKRPQDALALWVEDVRRDSFKVCLRETKIFDGLHKNIKVVSEFLSLPVSDMFESRQTTR